MDITTLPTERFNLSKIRTLSPNDAKTYVTSYFVPLVNGNHALYDNGIFTVRDDKELKQSYFSRMPRELQNYYFKDYLDVRQIAYDINKPVYFDDYINLCPRMKFSYDPNYQPSDRAQVSLDYVLDYINQVLCSSKIDCYTFLLKWLSNMIKGNKNTSCLYLKGIQGTGKSSLFQFLSNNVIGNPLCLETGSDPIRTKFNEILSGKLLVCFEELENFSKAEWESISSTLKKMITSNNITYQNKCTKAYESNNLNNYILISNNDAIKDDDGRRYFILDISTSKVGDNAYYTKLYECFNDEVGEAFFHMMMRLDTTLFNPQAFPITSSKMESLSKRLDSVYKFIKEQYVLQDRSINTSASDLFNEYKFMYKPIAKEDFHRKIAEIGIVRSTSGKKIWYNVEHSILLSIAQSKNWINDTDEYGTSETHNDVFDDDVSVKSDTTKSDTAKLINITKQKYKVNLEFNDL